ncbi:DUF4229 domain-containing protein [Kutzneria buriramensis]|uniref:Uncharacterized protein DUF4229 n=1 Tax=Kutzneria buriramensis TaxID=1045776 RepID=A0A3E0I9R4_9PSEU|nr:DUF4229 domain-containing protein [Kutzneria buriramensis]REH55379.1 uncharacterized protein DUF4229 [Kutzneria buriramensis]
METSTFGRDITVYTAARIGLLAVIAFLLTLAHVPLLIAVAVGLVLAWPLSMVLLRGLNTRIAAALTERRAERLKMRAQLRGEDTQ